MGVIKRQGFKFSIVSFIGVAIGVCSTLFIYPNALEMVGLFRFLFDASVLGTILVLLGSPTSAVRFFPKYRDEADYAEFKSLSLNYSHENDEFISFLIRPGY